MSTLLPIPAGPFDIPAYGELLRQFAPKVIENVQENRRAVQLLERLLDKDRSPEEDALVNLLAGLIDSFEREAFALPKSTPRERLQFLLDENGLKPADVAELMGGRPRVSAVLNGQREISKEQARRLGERFGVPPALFIY